GGYSRGGGRPRGSAWGHYSRAAPGGRRARGLHPENKLIALSRIHEENAMLAKLTLGLGVCLLALGSGRADEEKNGPLEGVYVIVAGEEGGKKAPASHIKGTTVRFTRDTVTVTDKAKKHTYAASYKLDTGKKPWRITMKATLGPDKGKEAKGLVEKKGDTVRLIYALPGGEMPTTFKTKDKQLMFVMKRAKK